MNPPQDCSGTELEQWSLLLKEWDDANPLVKPKQLPILVRRGIPEALRGEASGNNIYAHDLFCVDLDIGHPFAVCFLLLQSSERFHKFLALSCTTFSEFQS